MEVTIFLEICIVIITATVLAIIAKFLKQPLILAYVLAGALLGPLGAKIINSPELISGLSTIGVAFLLFLVGLELNLSKLKELGKPSLVIGLGQIVFTASIGFLLVRLFNFSIIASLYICIALTFSSTIIVVKLLSERKQLDSLPSRLSIGLLLVQDFAAIVLLVLLSAFQGQTPSLYLSALTLLKGLALFVFALLASKYFIGPLFDRLARSQELLFLSSISWCFLFAILAGLIGFSVEIGAFLAGVSLASLPYSFEISSRVRSLRDFFIIIFFVSLGSQLVISSLGGRFWFFLALSVFVLIGNPLIVMILMGLLGYRKRVAFLVAIVSGQISEFSLILVSLGYKLGHLSQEVISLVTAIAVVTFTLSTYFIIYDETLYRWLSPCLNIFERKRKSAGLEHLPEVLEDHVVVFGYHRLGRKIVDTLQKLRKKVVVVDFNPEVIKDLIQKKTPCFYGDASDSELLEHLNFKRAKMVISTVPDLYENSSILENIANNKFKMPVLVTATNAPDSLLLYEKGADYVIYPHYLGGEQLSLLLKETDHKKGIIGKHRHKHLEGLKKHY